MRYTIRDSKGRFCRVSCDDVPINYRDLYTGDNEVITAVYMSEYFSRNISRS